MIGRVGPVPATGSTIYSFRENFRVWLVAMTGGSCKTHDLKYSGHVPDNLACEREKVRWPIISVLTAYMNTLWETIMYR